MTDIGQNSGEVSGQKLKSYIERIERLEDEKKIIAEDIKDIYAEVKATGFCPKTIRKMVSLKRLDAQKRREEQEMLELYCAATQLELF